MKQFVRIQSTTNVYVNPGISYKDVTNPDAHVPDRLKVNPTWVKARVLIKAGVGYYPAEIINWNNVKALINNQVLTIGGTFTEDQINGDDKNTALAAQKNLDAALKEIETKSTKRKTSLKEIAD